MKKSPDYKKPISILEIGSIIEVEGTKIIAELSTAIVDLNRIYKGDVYPIGQFGSVIKIHFGMRILYPGCAFGKPNPGSVAASDETLYRSYP